jgi:hypothetical protein
MAQRTWRGGAVGIAQVDTITFALTWATADTVTVTINGKDFTFTVGDTSDVTTIAAAFVLGWNATSAPSLAANESIIPVAGASSIPEYAEITATSAAGVVTLTGDTLGKPFTMSVVEVTAGTGTSVEATSIAATGKNHFDNADNYLEGSVPVSTDDLLFDVTAQDDLLYALDQNAITLTSLTRTNGFTKKIGLPKLNVDSTSRKYNEYRDDYLKISATTVLVQGDGTGSGRTKFDFGSNIFTADIADNGTPLETDVPALLILGTHASSVLRVTKGKVGVAFFEQESAHLATLTVGWETNQTGDADVVCGSGVDLGNAAIVQTGGSLSIDSATGTGTIDQTGGSITIRSGAHASIEHSGTVFLVNCGTITTQIARGGVIDARQGTLALAITNLELNKGASYLDPQARITESNGIDINGCALADVTIDKGTHFTLTKTAI